MSNEKRKLTELPTAEEYREHFSINENGQLVWLKPKGTRAKIGELAGVLLPTGYRQICLNARQVIDWKVIQYMQTNSWPEENEPPTHIGGTVTRKKRTKDHAALATKFTKGEKLDKKDSREASRLKNIQKNNPTLLNEVKKGNLGISEAETLAAKRYEPSQEEVQALFEQLSTLANPADLLSLDKFTTIGLMQDYAEITKLMSFLSKTLSKKAITAYVKLLRYNQYYFESELINQLPKFITQREKALKDKEASFINRQKKADMLLDPKEIKRINQCLAPDRADPTKKAIFTAAFQSFQKLQ